MSVASILTAIVAVALFVGYLAARRKQRRRPEEYLRDEKLNGKDGGVRTILHLVANLGISEKDIVEASFRSKAISRTVSADLMGRASRLMLEYTGDDVTGAMMARKRLSLDGRRYEGLGIFSWDSSSRLP